MNVIVRNSPEYVKFADVKPMEFFSWHGGTYLKLKDVNVQIVDREIEIKNALTIVKEKEKWVMIATEPGELTFFQDDCDVITVRGELTLLYNTCWEENGEKVD